APSLVQNGRRRDVVTFHGLPPSPLPGPRPGPAGDRKAALVAPLLEPAASPAPRLAPPRRPPRGQRQAPPLQVGPGHLAALSGVAPGPIARPPSRPAPAGGTMIIRLNSIRAGDRGGLGVRMIIRSNIATALLPPRAGAQDDHRVERPQALA